MINSWCAELCKTMTALKTCWVQEVSSSNSSEDKHGKSNAAAASRNGHTVKMDTSPKRIIYTKDIYWNNISVSDMEYLPPNLRHVSVPSWGCLLTSHLSTFGTSIIVGFDNLAVNQVCIYTSKSSFKVNF